MNIIYPAKIAEVFSLIDEFCKQISQFKKNATGKDGKIGRAFKMSDSEIITILLLFHLSG